MNPYFTIQLELYNQQVVNSSIPLVQYDDDTTELRFKIFNSQVEIDYSELSEVSLITRQSDGSASECKATINADSISYLLCYHETSCIGQVTGELNLYYKNGGRKATQKFTYMVIPTLAIGIDPTDEENLPILQSLIQELVKIKEQTLTLNEACELAENIRKSNESLRIAQAESFATAEQGRATAEASRAVAESDRITAEDDRKASEVVRKTNEDLRQQSFNQFMADYPNLLNNLVSIAYNNNCPMITAKFEAMGEGEKIIPLFYNPQGYDYDITDVTIMPLGNSTGISDSNTSSLQIMRNFVPVISETFDDMVTFPANGSFHTIKLVLMEYNDEVTQGDLICAKLKNDIGVSTPEFILQLNYKIKQVEVSP